jgi:hypothetical protein
MTTDDRLREWAERQEAVALLLRTAALESTKLANEMRAALGEEATGGTPKVVTLTADASLLNPVPPELRAVLLEGAGAVDAPPDLDLDARCVVGEAIAPGVPNTELEPGGQQKGYVVLCEEERKKGFVRPVRRSYRHLVCGSITRMSQDIAETYARHPAFYAGTFCSTCCGHYLVGKDGEFVWVDAPGEKVGT